MSFIPQLITGGAGEFLKSVGVLAKDIRYAVTGQNPEVEMKLIELEAAAAQAQIQLNVAEAQHTSVFVAGWRPAIGWICAASLSWQFVFQPLFSWVVMLGGWDVPTPAFPTEGLMPLLMALLGLGGMRTWEKVKGAAGRH